MKKIFSFLTIALIAGFLLAAPVRAIFKLALSPVPEYQKSADFRLYYTYIDTDDNEAAVNLYVQKEGDSWRQTKDRDKTEMSGYFQIEDADIYAGEGKYNFYAQAKVGSLPAQNSATVSIIVDRTNPDMVSDYKKERVGESAYRLSWTNPQNDDFYRVFLYRSKDESFTADEGTKIGEAGGTPGEKQSFENSGLEKDTTYYYALRAIDRAGNSSDLVTDAPGKVIAGEVTIITTAVTATPAPAGAEGTILGEEEEEGEEAEKAAGGAGEAIEEGKEGTISAEGEATAPEGEVMGEAQSRTLKDKLVIIVPIAIVIIAIVAFFFFRKKKKTL